MATHENLLCAHPHGKLAAGGRRHWNSLTDGRHGGIVKWLEFSYFTMQNGWLFNAVNFFLTPHGKRDYKKTM